MSLIDKYQAVRAYSESLCRSLEPEDYVVQVAEFASPVKWHLAHTTWFYETFVLLEHLPDYRVFDDKFAYLFNSYYNNAGERILRSHRGGLSRPSTEMIYDYRRYVNQAMERLLRMPCDDGLKNLITLGLNHEQQHQELILTDVKFMLGANPLLPAYDKHYSGQEDEPESEQGEVKLTEGLYTVGYQGDGFCFDNERSSHQVYLNETRFSKALVSNREYLEFIEAGGYQDFNLWLDEGWRWLQQESIKAPLYWHYIDDVWYRLGLGGFAPVVLDASVCHISYYEASAFAHWAGKRLPTEFEWEAASSLFDWGKRWEWTNSAYLPYPGYQKASGAVGEYNGKFMSNQMVLRGASVATSEGHSRKTYRNFFYPQQRWQFTGIRLVK